MGTLALSAKKKGREISGRILFCQFSPYHNFGNQFSRISNSLDIWGKVTFVFTLGGPSRTVIWGLGGPRLRQYRSRWPFCKHRQQWWGGTGHCSATCLWELPPRHCSVNSREGSVCQPEWSATRSLFKWSTTVNLGGFQISKKFCYFALFVCKCAFFKFFCLGMNWKYSSDLSLRLSRCKFWNHDVLRIAKKNIFEISFNAPARWNA